MPGNRPSPDDIVKRVSELLSQDVLPGLSDPHLASQVGTAAALLQYVAQHWDTAVKELLAEIGELEVLLADTVEPLRAIGEDGAGARLERLIADREDDLAVSALQSRSDHLQSALLDALLVANRVEREETAFSPMIPRLRAELWTLSGRRGGQPG